MAELQRVIRDTHYPLSRRVRTLRGILDKLEPPPVREPSPAAAEGVCDTARQAGPAPRPTVNRCTGPPATLGSTAAAGARLIVWCRDCRHQFEPDAAEMAERYGAELAVPAWHKRLVCGQCGSRKIDFVVTGAKR